ncbi:L-2,4-diaminobutyric acid acetyltransferase [Actinopolyspora xinjiangensis]|uniref:L-2,4-diaminobutyric acid acetyltransferase n=1 Tax=Actinopolyspora xinjiangensis TaxID=405564 RepID=A0A1H0PC06_9ACTN|nr:L-2,4-diaminobutyric acid acetyltransferase [Actinopolyspora xinjiangensis]
MTGEKPGDRGARPDDASGSAGRVEIDTPAVADGPELYRITRDSGVLDVNSPYAYLLWCRDFASTSLVARSHDGVVGFVTGYVRPDAVDTLVVWQIGVDAALRGHGVAGRLLERLFGTASRDGIRYLETTITADNSASINLFAALARDHGAPLEVSELFPSELFPDSHVGEDLYRIGPLAPEGATVPDALVGSAP